MEKKCKNCASVLDDKYCSHCGQSDNNGTMEWRELWTDVISYLFNVESPVWKTILQLSKNPGKLSKDYIGGRRKTYYKPVQYFILSLAVYILIKTIIKFEPVDAMLQITGVSTQVDDTSVIVGHWMSRNINYILPFWVVIISLFDRLFFRSSMFSLAGIMVHYLFSVSHFILLSTLIMILTVIFPYFIFLNYVMLLTYMTASVYTFHSGRKLIKGIKSFFLVLLSFILYATLSQLVVTIILKWKGIL